MGCAVSKRTKREPPLYLRKPFRQTATTAGSTASSATTTTVSPPIVIPPTLSSSLSPHPPDPVHRIVVEENEEEWLPSIAAVVDPNATKKWCVQMLEEWRDERDKTAPVDTLHTEEIQPISDWPSAKIVLVRGENVDFDPATPVGDRSYYVTDSTFSSSPKLSEENKDDYLRRVNADKERRKRARCNEADDTVFEVPTRMPTVSFSFYSSGDSDGGYFFPV